jgi:hypothetical protein
MRRVRISPSIALVLVSLCCFAGEVSAQSCSPGYDFACVCSSFCVNIDPFDCGGCSQDYFTNTCYCSIAPPPQGIIHASAVTGCSSGEGTTTITWTTNSTASNTVVVRVYVSGSEYVFASGRSGSASAPWITPGSTYEFRLYEAASSSTYFGGDLLASVQVSCP